MLAPQRSETDVPVVPCVPVPSHPEEPDVEQANREGEGVFPLRALGAQKRSGSRPHRRQPLREREHVLELLLVAPCAPERVIEILTAPLGIEPGCLEMVGRVASDPDVSPRRRDRQRRDPRQRFRVRDSLTGAVDDDELTSIPALLPSQTELPATDVSQLILRDHPGIIGAVAPPRGGWVVGATRSHRYRLPRRRARADPSRAGLRPAVTVR